MQCEATNQSYRNEVETSLQLPLQFLSSITSGLELKGKLFSVFKGASEDEMEAFWEVIHLVDDSLDQNDTSKSTFQRRPKCKPSLMTTVKSITIVSV